MNLRDAVIRLSSTRSVDLEPPAPDPAMASSDPGLWPVVAGTSSDHLDPSLPPPPKDTTETGGGGTLAASDLDPRVTRFGIDHRAGP